MAQPDDMSGDDDYPAYTMGRAAEITGASQDFLRRLDEAKLYPVPVGRRAPPVLPLPAASGRTSAGEQFAAALDCAPGAGQVACLRQKSPAEVVAAQTKACQSDQRACADQTLRDRLAANTKTYVYEFAERNGPPFTSIWRLGTDYPFGATHVNDLGYLWDYLGTALPFNWAQVDLSDQMISYWGAFARTGVPQVKFAPTWPRHTSGGDLLQFVAPSAQRVSHTTIDNEHNCSPEPGQSRRLTTVSLRT